MEKRFRFRFDRSQSITQSQIDTESSFGLDRSPSNPPTPTPTTPGVHVLSNGEVKELEFKELVDEMTRPKVDLSSVTLTTRPNTPTEISIGPLGDSYSNFEQFRSRRRAFRTDEDTEVKRPLLQPEESSQLGVHSPTQFAAQLEGHSTAAAAPSSLLLSGASSSSSHPRPPLQRIPTIGLDPTVGENPGLCAFLLTIISVMLIIATLPFSMFLCIKVVQEYERAVIFRLGRLVKGGAKGPGIFFIIPCIDSYCKVDLRTVSFDVPPQEILSRDSVTVAVDAVVYYRISNATVAVSNVEDYGRSTRLLAATTLRNVLGTKDLSQILSERESISHVMQSSLDEATDPWGVKVERVEIKDVRLPVQLQRAMAAEAEAAREARAKVIAAEGEQRASKALKEAAEVMTHNPAALQLRYLQTLSSIAGEKNSTIVFPIPMELFRSILKPDRAPTPQPPPQSMA